MGFLSKKHNSNPRKIFCIGLSGTGTRSLNEAFKILGYNSKHYPRSLEDFETYDVLLDIPVSCRYQDLDILFPGSRFILTTREMDSWLDNRVRKPADLHEKSLWVRETRLRTYGSPEFDKEKYTQLHRGFHQGVDQYFSERPEDLLKMNIIGGEGWGALCQFLHIHEIPIQPFPVVKNIHSPG
jgi:Sulfotransferase domain